jgi:hypothetical protein
MVGIALLAATVLVAASEALYFRVERLQATDVHNHPESHSIKFSVSAPENLQQQGGNQSADCKLSWNTNAPPTCWQPCGEHTRYFTRIMPESYTSADSFSIDIWQSYVYEIGNHNNATVKASEGRQKLSCSRDRHTTTCGLSGNYLNVNEQQFFG